MQALTTVFALTGREILKFVRDRSRLLGAFTQPIAFWLLLGLGFQDTFQMPGSTAGVDYVEFLFPGVIALVLLFTAIFSTISIVEERTSGFLQAVMVAPTPRTALVFGNALGGTILSTVQALLILLALPFIGIYPNVAGVILILAICLLTGLSFTALGFTIAWRMDTTRGFHAVMNLFLLPLWFLSGAMFPYEGAAPVLQWLVWINPVSYAVSGIRHGMYGLASAPGTLASPLTSISVSLGFAVLMIGVAVWTVRRPFFSD
ncbi:ABC transporter [Longibacter salinarum]|uniref:Transport permease protein n=1 Tax=Longibacter salinarum TaxID=1850348 RepID=A0A2A8D0P4_9BACT|nr:ABC transporter permease [Longibacter salinarum]PEN14549.1 ABC transporter [Longibacter salinarum]